MQRRTIVVHMRLTGHMARVAAARAGDCGVQVITMDHLAARLAGGFIRPIDPDALHEAVRAALAETPMGELERIKSLPGMVRATVDTLGKVWRAGIDLGARPEEPRLRALAALERAACGKLPAAMQPPPSLVEAALARLRHAPAVIGSIEVHGHSEMPPCWRRLLLAVADIVPVVWVAGPRHVPEWLAGTKVEIQLDIAEALPIDPHRPEGLRQLNLWTEPAQIAHPLARDVLEKLQSIGRRARSTTPHMLLSDSIEALSVRPQLRHRYRTGTDRALANVDLFLEMARTYDTRGLRSFARDMRANWDEAVRQVEGRPDAAQESVALVTIHAAKGLEWPVVIPINMMGPPYEDNAIAYDRSAGRFSTAICGVAPGGHAPIANWVAQEQARERVRLWYVATTRARDLLVLPRHLPDLAANSWGQVVDLGLASLPAIDPTALPGGVIGPAEPAGNAQTRNAFAAEAKRIAETTRKIQWQRPSRNEGDASGPLPEAPVFMSEGTVEEAPDWIAPEVAGGATRGTSLHKLMEEVLTGETPNDRNSLLTRATELLCQLGIEPASDARQGIAPVELAETVLRTLALPDIAALRPRLVPESTVYGHLGSDQAETLVSGIADAIEVDELGRLSTVIDWKSDVAPSASQIEHYRVQIDLYRRHTGARRALLVFMTTGSVIALGP